MTSPQVGAEEASVEPEAGAEEGEEAASRRAESPQREDSSTWNGMRSVVNVSPVLWSSRTYAQDGSIEKMDVKRNLARQ